MAKSRNKRKKRADTRKQQRRYDNITRHKLLFDDPFKQKTKVIHNDRRFFRDSTLVPELTIDDKAAQVRLRPLTKNKKYVRTHGLFQFDKPHMVKECRNRKSRREVLFKNRKIGKGKSVSRFKNLTPKSKISCKG